MDVELVSIHEFSACGSQQTACALEKPGFGHLVIVVDLIRCDARVMNHVKPSFFAECLQAIYITSGEGFVFYQQSAGIPTPDHGEMLARICCSSLLQCLDHRGKDFKTIAWRHLDPAGDAENSAGLQVLQVLGKRLYRV